MTTPDRRLERLNSGDRKDQRSEFQRDRDRLLYCSAFRRLAEITQVVSASEGHSFHNRLTHTLKVAQIARRLAEKIAADAGQADLLKELGGIEPEVAEAAALAHDLGHPPFGHIAEEELNELACKEGGEEDGFEGNAQSFRIITKLAIRRSDYDGLNLTAATLNAVLKYPWYRAGKGDYRRKWGVYPTEKAAFEWARQTLGLPDEVRSIEAELMDWADDIAYSVFDVDDFYRAGLVPLDRLFADRAEVERFLASASERLKRWGKDPGPITSAFTALIQNFPPTSLRGAYEGSVAQRALLREWTSRLVARYIDAISLRKPTPLPPPEKIPTTKAEIEGRHLKEIEALRRVAITPDLKNEVESLKQLVWHYVIENPRLVTQQHGARHVIRSLFLLFKKKAEAACGGNSDALAIFPEPYQGALRRPKEVRDSPARIVVDMIAGMTETETLKLHNRLIGVSLGSIHDHI